MTPNAMVLCSLCHRPVTVALGLPRHSGPQVHLRCFLKANRLRHRPHLRTGLYGVMSGAAPDSAVSPSGRGLETPNEAALGDLLMGLVRKASSPISTDLVTHVATTEGEAAPNVRCEVVGRQDGE